VFTENSAFWPLAETTGRQQTRLNFWQDYSGDCPNVASLVEDIEKASGDCKESLVVLATLDAWLEDNSVVAIGRLIQSLTTKHHVLALTTGGQLDQLSRLATLVHLREDDYGRITVDIGSKVDELIVDFDTNSVTVKERSKKDQRKETTAEEDADISSLTTFNLTLTDKEKLARHQLVLPHEEEEVRIVRQSAASSGPTIHYSPDEADDWDDEDPDEDLDI